MEEGTIVRFDRVQGYGFIAPDSGGDDVFFHASLLDDSAKDLALRGTRVEYRATGSDRGPKAVAARLLGTPAAAVESVPRVDDELCEVVPAAEFAQAVTDVLIEVAPSVTGAQIAQIRQRLVGYARRYGWLEG